jgi:CBS domain-containing protein
MDIMDLAEGMVGNRPKLYPVLENGTVIGMVTRTDVLAALVSFRKSATNRV